MDELLSKLSVGFKIEQTTSHEAVVQRTQDLKEYLATLDQVSVKIGALAQTHKDVIVPLEAQKVGLEREHNAIVEKTTVAQTTHDANIVSQQSQLTSIAKDISEAEDKRKILDKENDARIAEGRSLEKRLDSARANVITAERRERELTTLNETLEADLQARKIVRDQAIVDTKEAQAHLATLSSDAAVLEQRMKKNG